MKIKPMKIFHLIILFFTANLFAQNQRFIYEYSFSNDSTALDKLRKEIMYLDVAKKALNFTVLIILKLIP